MKIREAKSDPVNELASRAYYCLFLQIDHELDRRLYSTANAFTFKFPLANALVLYNLLLQLPLDAQQFYLMELRNRLVLELDRQLMDPANRLPAD